MSRTVKIASCNRLLPWNVFITEGASGCRLSDIGFFSPHTTRVKLLSVANNKPKGKFLRVNQPWRSFFQTVETSGVSYIKCPLFRKLFLTFKWRRHSYSEPGRVDMIKYKLSGSFLGNQSKRLPPSPAESWSRESSISTTGRDVQASSKHFDKKSCSSIRSCRKSIIPINILVLTIR